MKYELNWKREYSLFYGATALYSNIQAIREDLGRKIAVRGEGFQGWFTAFSTMGTVDALKIHIKKKVNGDLSYVSRQMLELMDSGEALLSFVRNLKITKKNSDQEIINLYQQFFDNFVQYCAYLWRSFYIPEAVSDLFVDFIKAKLSPKEINEAIEVYSVPSKKAAVLIISDFLSMERNKWKRIQYLQKNYPWLMSTDPFNQPLDDNWIAEYVSSFVLKEQIKKKQLGLENEPIIKIYQDTLYMKDKRDEYRREAFYLILPLLKEISRRKGVSISDLGYILPDELSLTNLRTVIEQRKEGYIIEIEKGKRTIDEGKTVISRFLHTQNKGDTSVVQGLTGSPGIVKGTVQIIRQKKDLASFKEGNILVATTTNPDYLPAMQKAIAFVTDEGGITCHAAIVARELKKPCLVGTKTATKVFKDGDTVEVDGEKGVVKRVS